MLREDDLELQIGRCKGGSFLLLRHIPTGVFRMKGPLGETNRQQLVEMWKKEIEQELIRKGNYGHLLPALKIGRRKRTRP